VLWWCVAEAVVPGDWHAFALDLHTTNNPLVPSFPPLHFGNSVETAPKMRTRLAVPLTLLLWPVMSSAFVPMGTLLLRANARSQRSIATCIFPPLPSTVLASSAAIGHMSLSGSEIAEETSILVVLAMTLIFISGLFTDKQRLKPLSHLQLESQTTGGAPSSVHRILPHRILPHRILPHRILPHRILPHRILPHRILPHRILPHRILPQAARPPLAFHRRTGVRSASWSQRQRPF